MLPCKSWQENSCHSSPDPWPSHTSTLTSNFIKRAAVKCKYKVHGPQQTQPQTYECKNGSRKNAKYKVYNAIRWVGGAGYFSLF